MQEIGPQYLKDDQTDRTGFLKRARLHQSTFRATVLNVPFDTYGNYLTQTDGGSGKNFFDGFGIFEAVKEYRKYNKPLYSNMLRSEHIPFNLFIPLREDLDFCRNIFNDFLDNTIQKINTIKIEYAPKLKEKYLNDGTSFDAYIEYTHRDTTTGIIGIEVKYTEKEYKLQQHSKQEKDIRHERSKYFSVTDSSKLYKPGTTTILITDKFRQLWRNHILGESILLTDADKFRHFTSLTLFPKDNIHFLHTSKEYCDLLLENKNNFLPLTYEQFLTAGNKYCPNNNYREWLDYLESRYIIRE